MPEIEFKAISGYTEETIRSLHKKAIYWGLFEEQKRLQTLPDPEEADENDAEEGDAMDVEEAGKEGKKKKVRQVIIWHVDETRDEFYSFGWRFWPACFVIEKRN